MKIEISSIHLALFYDECKYFSITIFLNRPLIGVSFCKLKQVILIHLLTVLVSVPLSGLISVNQLYVPLKGDMVLGVFPSPYRG